MESVVSLVAFAVLLLLVQEFFRRTGKWVAWGVFLGLPLALMPVWIRATRDGVYREAGVFPWVKLYTIAICAVWFTTVRCTQLGQRRWALGLCFLLLPINILEAVAKDLTGGHLAHYLLAATGVMLIVCVPHPLRAIRVDTASPFRELYYEGMTRAWIVGYTLWNWAFVYLNFPALAAHHLAVLGAAFAVGMIEPRRWLMARTLTLGFDLLLLATFPRYLTSLADSSHWAMPHRENLVAGTCLVFVAMCCADRFVRRRGDRSRYWCGAEPGAAMGSSARFVSGDRSSPVPLSF